MSLDQGPVYDYTNPDEVHRQIALAHDAVAVWTEKKGIDPDLWGRKVLALAPDDDRSPLTIRFLFHAPRRYTPDLATEAWVAEIQAGQPVREEHATEGAVELIEREGLL